MPETRRRMVVVGHLGPRHTSLCEPDCIAKRHLTQMVDNSLIKTPRSGRK